MVLHNDIKLEESGVLMKKKNEGAFQVVLADGTVISERNQALTYVAAIRALGPERIASLAFNEHRYPIVTKDKARYKGLDGSVIKTIIGSSWLVNTKHSIGEKMSWIRRIAQELGEYDVLVIGSNASKEVVKAQAEISSARHLFDDAVPTEQMKCAVVRLRHQLLANRAYARYGCCVLTGISQRPLLVASHIKPWAKCVGAKERLDEDNILLLSVAYDRLFDRGYISFADDGRMLVGSQITQQELALLGIRDSNLVKLPKGLLTEKRLAYLAYHRKYVFEKSVEKN